MANLEQITATYDYMDEIYRLTYGEHADVSAAMFNGDFSMTVEEAQANKHKRILEGINFKPGDRVLDIGCGWGPILNAVHRAGGKGVGFTLSPAQAAACRAHGYEAHVQDAKTITPDKIGMFDAVVAMGPIEHLCSIEEFRAGEQEAVYRQFFDNCATFIPVGGRMYVQSMLFGKKVPDPDTFSVHAPKGSDEWVMALTSKLYPGSWLPSGLEQIVECCDHHFKLVSENNGRLDYIETMQQWSKMIKKKALSFTPLMKALKHVPRLFSDPDFKYQIQALYYATNQTCFRREIMSHQRMFFEKIK